MQNETANFEKITLELLSEEGPAKCRKSWVRARKLAKQLNSAHDYIGKLPPETLAVLSLVKTEDFSSDRADNLQKIFAAHLGKFPEHNFVEALRLFPFKDLQKTLLPFIYDSGNVGKIACYLAAKLKVFADPDAYPFFLKVKKWNNSELMNLAHLVRPNEVFAVLDKLEAQCLVANSGVSREAFDEFRYILVNRDNHQPVFPDLIMEQIMPATSAEEEDQKLQEIVPPSDLKIPKESDGLIQLEKILQPLKKNFYFLSGQEKPLAAMFFALLALYFSFSFLSLSDDEDAMIKPPPRSRKAPDSWVDATTQKEITEKFLAADKDYRMGELYLTRDKFLEAISLFEDALSLDPGHDMARLRLGFCRMRLGQFDQAIPELNRLIKSDAQIKLANLYLAQIAVQNNDLQLAEKHYAAEIKINKDLSVGLEYAGFLQRIGQSGKAEMVLDELRKYYPDRTLIVTNPGKPEQVAP